MMESGSKNGLMRMLETEHPTTKKSLKDALTDMLKNEKPDSKYARIEAVMPEIEKCLAAGFTYRQIAAKLTATGLSINLHTLTAHVSKIRKVKRSSLEKETTTQ